MISYNYTLVPDSYAPHLNTRVKITTMSQEHLSRFIAIRERIDNEQVFTPQIESSLLSLLSSERDELFQLALSVWITAFNPNLLEKLLINVSQENDIESEKIKLIRKQGVILDSAYSFFDKRQTAPTHHNYLMKKIGKLNDPVPIDRFLRAKSQAITANTIYNSVITLDYQPETDQEYQDHIAITLQNLRNTFKKRTLILPEFHLARKELRKLMNLLQIRAVLHSDARSYAELSNWFMLNTQLGKINDLALVDSAGDKERYNSMIVKIDSHLLSQVLAQLG